MWIEANIAFKFLRQGRIQTALILVGVAVGVAVIVFVVALINALQGNIIERTLGTQSHIRVQSPEEINLRPPTATGRDVRRCGWMPTTAVAAARTPSKPVRRPKVCVPP